MPSSPTIGFNKVSSSQMLLLISPWLIYYQQVCRPLWKQTFFSVYWFWRIPVYVNTMPRKKDVSNGLAEAIVAAHPSGEVYKTIPKQFGAHHSTVRKLIHKWKAFCTAANLSTNGLPTKFTPRSDMVREITHTYTHTYKRNSSDSAYLTENAFFAVLVFSKGCQKKAPSFLEDHENTDQVCQTATEHF